MARTRRCGAISSRRIETQTGNKAKDPACSTRATTSSGSDVVVAASSDPARTMASTTSSTVFLG